MKELLERWAELEPERCEIVRDRFAFHCMKMSLLIAEFDSGNDMYADVLVQAATQQAIEAQGGWTWSLLKDTAGTYKARVWINDVVYHTANSNTSPAEALLTAYLAVLEAVKTEEVVG